MFHSLLFSCPQKAPTVLTDHKTHDLKVSDLNRNQSKMQHKKGHCESGTARDTSQVNEPFMSDHRTVKGSSAAKNICPSNENKSVTDDEGKEISVERKSNDSSLMEVSFASLSKSRPAQLSSSSEMSSSYADKSFQQYRESPLKTGNKKSDQPSSKIAIKSDSEESSDESDMDKSHAPRKGIQKLNISDKEDASKRSVPLQIKVKQEHFSGESSEKGKQPLPGHVQMSEVTSKTKGTLEILHQEKECKNAEQKSTNECPKMPYTVESLNRLLNEKQVLTSELQKMKVRCY